MRLSAPPPMADSRLARTRKNPASFGPNGRDLRRTTRLTRWARPIIANVTPNRYHTKPDASLPPRAWVVYRPQVPVRRQRHTRCFIGDPRGARYKVLVTANRQGRCSESLRNKRSQPGYLKSPASTLDVQCRPLGRSKRVTVEHWGR